MNSQTQDNSEKVLLKASSQLGNPVTFFTKKLNVNASIEQGIQEAAILMSDLAKLKASGKKQLLGEDGAVLIEKVD